MRSARSFVLALLSIAVASPVMADVTLKQKAGGTGLGAAAAAGEMTQYVKGLKIRTDQMMSGKMTSTVMDASLKQMVVLDHAAKEANVYDMTKVAESLAKVPVSEIKTSIVPTGKTREVAGSTCTVYDVKVAVPMQMGDNSVAIVLSGPYCLVKNGPGQADFSAFYRAAAENGFILGDPRQAKAQPAQSKAMTEMYRKMSELGVPFATETNITFEGSGPMAAMMGKMGTQTMTTEVTSVSTAPIADSVFEVPAGYKLNRR
jgi:hypothetical protein